MAGSRRGCSAASSVAKNPSPGFAVGTDSESAQVQAAALGSDADVGSVSIHWSKTDHTGPMFDDPAVGSESRQSLTRTTSAPICRAMDSMPMWL